VSDDYDIPLQAGTMVGEYRIVEPIGAGGMGVVYRAVHPMIERDAAIKVIKSKYVCQQSVVRRFEHEARLLGKLRHPGIIDVFGFGALPDGRRYYVMDLLQGQPLSQCIVERQRLTLRETLTVVVKVAAALDAAHKRGVVHRDVKPSNIFLQSDVRGGVVLLDFGVAKLMTRDLNLTAAGQIAGSPPYMSPEHCRGNVDHRSDIYSLAIVVYECLSGRTPFVGPTMEVIDKHLVEPPPRLAQWAPEHAALDQPLSRALSKDPAQRQQRASELARELAASCGMSPQQLDEPLAFQGTAAIETDFPPDPAADTAVELNTVPFRHERARPADAAPIHQAETAIRPVETAVLDVEDPAVQSAPAPVKHDGREPAASATHTALLRRRWRHLAAGILLGVVGLGALIAVLLARTGGLEEKRTVGSDARREVVVVPLRLDARPFTGPDAAAADMAPARPDTLAPADTSRPPPPPTSQQKKPRRKKKKRTTPEEGGLIRF
jgi:tRNA A-37 threonylcarbamoyl transferase component Bud32